MTEAQIREVIEAEMAYHPDMLPDLLVSGPRGTFASYGHYRDGCFLMERHDEREMRKWMSKPPLQREEI